MTQDETRWQEVKEVLDAALDQPPEQRSAFLDQVCTDQELRRRVETLLAEEREDFIDRPIFSWRREGEGDGKARRRPEGRRPIEARAPSRVGPARKLAARRFKEILATAALLAMVASLAGLVLERRDAEQHRRRLQREAENSDRLTRFVVETLQVVDPQANDGRTFTPEEILDLSAKNATEYLEGFPATHAAVLSGIASVLTNRGNHPRAFELLEETLRQERRVYDEKSWQIGDTLNDLASIAGLQGDYLTAEKLYREALERPHTGPDGSPLHASNVMDNLGKALTAQGKLSEAEEYLRRGLEMRLELYGNADHPDVSTSLNNLAITLRQAGRYDEAAALYQRALAINDRLGSDLYDRSTLISNLGKLYCEQGRFEAGDRQLRESLEMRRRIFGETDHPAIAYSLRELGVCRQLQGDLAWAAALYQEAAEIYVRREEESHPHFGITLRELANLRLAEGDPAAARETIRRSLEIYGASLTPGHWRVADAESVLGACLLELGRVEEAAPLIERGYLGTKAVRGETTREVREARERFERLEARRSPPAG